MVNKILQVIGFAIGLLGTVLSITTTFLPSWQKSEIQGEVIESIQRYNGLWTRCIVLPIGITNCDAYDTFFLGLPIVFQIARNFACVSMGLGLKAVVFSALGLICAALCKFKNTKLTAVLVIYTGVLFVISGACIGVAVSWFAFNIDQNYNNSIAFHQTNKYVYGDALYVGWASMAISALGGLVLCFSCRNTDDYNRGFIGNL